MRIRPLLLMSAFASSAFLSAAEPAVTFVRELGGIREFRVEANGLRVLLARDPSAPDATVMTTFHVGSRNEVTGTTGATHLLEHLYFKGTERFNRPAGTSLDLLLDRVGATNNATTWTDRTNYYVNTPPEQLPLVFDLLADHLQHLRLREEDRQPEMTVVRNEFEIGENDPHEALDKAIWAAAFVAHPYHHSTIGWRSDIERVPIEKLREFHRTYYHPDNCTLSVAGNFTESTALELVRQFFAPIPRAPRPIPGLYTEEPEQQGPRRVIVKRPAELGAVGIGFKRPAGLSPDSAALAVLDRILVEGKNARLYRTLVDTGLATDVGVSNYEFRDPGLFTVYVFLAPDVKHERAEAALLAALRAVTKDGVTAEEVARAQRQYAAQTAYGRDGSLRMIEQLNEAIAVGDWTTFVGDAAKVAAVTPADVLRVARAVLADDRSTTGWFVAESETPAPDAAAPAAQPTGETLGASGNSGRTEGSAAATAAVVVASAPPTPALPRDAAAAPLAAGAVQRTLAGIDVVAVPTGVKDVVTIEGSLAAGSAFNPAGNTAVAPLVAALLDKGTARHDKLALAKLLDDRGARIEFTSERFALRFSVRCLRADVGDVLALLAEQLREPAFAAAEITKEKARLAGDWQRAFEDPEVRAAVAFSRAVWPEGHPNRQAELGALLADLKKVTRKQLEAFHRAQFGPKSCRLVAVGDLDPAAFGAAVEKAFRGWTGGASFVAPARIAEPRTRGETVPVAMDEKPSVTVVIGQTTGLAAREPEALALRLASHVLGGGSFSSRLMATVRDTEGLTYHIWTRVADDTFGDGAWYIRGTFATELLEKGEAATKRELRRWYEQGLGDDEFAAQKANFLGVTRLGFATTDGLANGLLTALNRGQTLAEFGALPDRVAALSKADVEAAMRRLLDPAKMVTVRAGTLPK